MNNHMEGLPARAAGFGLLMIMLCLIGMGEASASGYCGNGLTVSPCFPGGGGPPPTEVPIPGTVALMIIGGVGALISRVRRGRKG